MTMNVRRVAALTLALGLGACGGDAGAPQPGPAVAQQDAPQKRASTLRYADPVSDGWRLVRSAASTPTRLVLDVVGPAGVRTHGVALTLEASSDQVRFVPFEDGELVRDTGVLTLAATPNAPRLLAGAASGRRLTLGAFQKGSKESPKDAGQPLMQLAVALAPGATFHPKDVVVLRVLKARITPEDIGLPEARQLLAVPVATGAIRFE